MKPIKYDDTDMGEMEQMCNLVRQNTMSKQKPMILKILPVVR